MDFMNTSEFLLFLRTVLISTDCLANTSLVCLSVLTALFGLKLSSNSASCFLAFSVKLYMYYVITWHTCACISGLL